MEDEKEYLKAVALENFRNENGDFPSENKCSNCNTSSEVYIEIIRGGPIMRLCKGCLSDYIEMIDKCYVNEMRSK